LSVKFRRGQVVRVTAIYDVGLPFYARIEALGSAGATLSRVVGDAVEQFQEVYERIVPLSKEEGYAPRRHP
jgi:hypothetical protein